MGMDWIRRMLGFDVPFRAAPPPGDVAVAIRVDTRAFEMQMLKVQITLLRLSFVAQRNLLERVIAPFASDLEERELHNDIRRHLRATSDA